MVKFETYDIYWEGPFSVEWSEQDQWYYVPELEETKGDLNMAAGLCQVYGQHPVYGPNTLLYIGQTKEHGGFVAKLNKRLAESTKPGRFSYHIGLSVVLGRVYEADSEAPVINERLANVESLLIASHFPAANRKDCDCPLYGARNYLVFNYWMRGSLLPICAGRWFDYTGEVTRIG